MKSISQWAEEMWEYMGLSLAEYVELRYTIRKYPFDLVDQMDVIITKETEKRNERRNG